MTRLFLTIALCLSIPAAASSEGLWKKIKKGASDAGEAVENTAKDAGTAISNTASDVGTAVGNTASDVGDAIEKSVDSTVEMVSDEDTAAETRARIDQVADETLAQLLSENPQAAELYEKSYGYAAFDARQLTLIGTAGYGRGVAVDKATGGRTYMKMGTGGVGLAFGIGGFERKIVFLFENTGEFTKFVEDGYDATAEASSMSGEDHELEQAHFVEGRRMFYLSKKGWRIAATATGTKYWKDTKLN